MSEELKWILYLIRLLYMSNGGRDPSCRLTVLQTLRELEEDGIDPGLRHFLSDSQEGSLVP